MKRKNWMQLLHPVLPIAGLLLIAVVSVRAGDTKIVANPSVGADTISISELRGVFLLQRRILKDGSAVEPVLQKSGSIHEQFLKQYLDRNREEIHTYYQGLVFTGKASIPKQLGSEC